MEDKKVIDIDYEDYKEEDSMIDDSSEIINGEPLFYSAMQVSILIDEDVSTVRYWSKRFDKLLNIEISNKNRRQYKKVDIQKLKFIKKLAREDGLTLSQIEEYANTKGFNIDNIEKSVLDSSNPLAIQTFISAVTMELDKKLSLFSEELLSKINEQQKVNFVMQQEINEQLQQTLAITVDEIVSERLDEKLNTLDTKLQEFKSTLDTKEQEATKRDTEMIEYLKQHMEERKKENELQLQQQKKGFFSRLFGK